MTWCIYWNNGLLSYATHSIAPFERLDRHLRAIARTCPTLTSEVRNNVRLKFEEELFDTSQISPDLQAINWLHTQNHLTTESAKALIHSLTIEVLESYCLLPQDIYEFQKQEIQDCPVFSTVNAARLLHQIKKNLEQWQALGPQVKSSYQRPYLSELDAARQQIPQATIEKLQRLLRGFNFHQLALLLNQEPLEVAQRLHPLIANGVLLLQPPLAPFDVLPLVPSGFESFFDGIPPTTSSVSSDSPPPLKTASQPSPPSQPFADDAIGSMLGTMPQQASKVWKVLCIDDSQAMLNEIKRLLNHESLQVSSLNDSKMALMKINTLKPDLVLLDVTMPGIDGYQVCSMIRKSATLKSIPVVMVTGNKALVDRAKARLSGATDYLIKPFTKDDLIQMVFRYLSD